MFTAATAAAAAAAAAAAEVLSSVCHTYEKRSCRTCALRYETQTRGKWS